jgi:hypothetical protein
MIFFTSERTSGNGEESHVLMAATHFSNFWLVALTQASDYIAVVVGVRLG